MTSAGVDESVMAWTRVAVATRQELYDAGWKEGIRERAAGYPSAATVMFRFSTPINRDNESEVVTGPTPPNRSCSHSFDVAFLRQCYRT